MTDAAKAVVWDASMRSMASKSVAAVRRAAFAIGIGNVDGAFTGPVVPGRDRLALQLAPELRSHAREVYAA